MNSANAFEYWINEVKFPVSKPYQGDRPELTATIQPSSNNQCTITCKWKTNNFGPTYIGNPEPLAPGQPPKTFGFLVNVQGTNGQVNDKLIVTCERVSSPSCL